MVKNLPVLHLGINSAIPPRSQWKISLTFDDDLAFIGKGRNATLREKDNSIFIIPKVIIGLEVINDLIMVHLACHQIPFDKAPCIVDSSSVFGNLAEANQTIGKVSKQSESTFQSKVIHTFRMIEPESCSLSSTHNAYSYLSR